MESATRAIQSPANSFTISGFFSTKKVNEVLDLVVGKFEFFMKSADDDDIYAVVPYVASTQLVKPITEAIESERPVIIFGYLDTEDRYSHRVIINEIVHLEGPDPKVNRLTLIGRIGGNQPGTDSPYDFKVFASGRTLAKFSLAVRKAREEVYWIPCEAWERTGVILVDYAKKGDQVALFGRLKYEEWDSSDGRRYKLGLNAQSVSLLGGSNNGSGNSDGNRKPESESTEQPSVPTVKKRRTVGTNDDAKTAAESLATATNGTVIDNNDDIPF